MHSWTRQYVEVSDQLHAAAALVPGKEPPGTHLIGGWMGHKTGLDSVVKKKFPAPAENRIPTVQFVAPTMCFYITH